ncbi:hypothetical protein Tco_1506081 [Tanacetum coccineum]
MPEQLPIKLSSAALAVLTTRLACHPSLTSCLSSHGESLRIVLTLQYPTTVAVSDVHGAGTRVHIPAHGGSEAHNGPPDSILSHKPNPLGKLGLLLYNQYCLLMSYPILHKQVRPA